MPLPDVCETTDAGFVNYQSQNVNLNVCRDGVCSYFSTEVVTVDCINHNTNVIMGLVVCYRTTVSWS